MASSTSILIPRAPTVPRRRMSRWGETACRARDVLTAAALNIAIAPGWLLLALLALAGWGRWQTVVRLGRHRLLYDEHVFCPPVPWAWLNLLGRAPVLWNLLRGDIALVGPRAITLDDPLAELPDAQPRFDVRPGLVCLYWVRRHAHIAYEPEWCDDVEYVLRRSFFGDLGIMARAVVAALVGRGPAQHAPRVCVLGIEVDNLTMAEALAHICLRLHDHRQSQVCFVNADCANLAYRNDAYRQVLNQATLTLADGIGIRLAGHWLESPIRENVNGTDLFPRLCQTLEAQPQSIFLLGGKPGVAEGVAAWIGRCFPDCQVAGCRDGYFSPDETGAVVKQIRESGATLLLVALGAPRQDLWIAEHLAATGCRVGIGVGGLFDFYSGRIPRAPLWLRELGLEWLYRFWQEPGRLWKRYLIGNAVFLFRVARCRWQRESHPAEADRA